MSDWTDEASRAIALCESWAADVKKQLDCQLFLFGSAIYKGGEQFDSTSSDLDIVCLLPEQADALRRAGAMLVLYRLKQRLELQMVPALHRTTCDEPGVSIVPITPLELRANIHKSGARRFFDKNFFYDLVAKRETLGIPGAGTRVMRDERRQAIEYVQKVRNDYLSVSANGMGGLAPYEGADPMPKALMRSAAQLVPDTAEGEWYDTRLGLEHLYSMLRDRRTESPEMKQLFDKISVRRGGRGKKVHLTDDDQLLLAEMLFDEGSALGTEEVVTWDIHIIGRALTDEDAQAAFAAILRIVPDATLVGHSSGSVILRVRSSAGGFELLVQLQELQVLAVLLRAETVSLSRVHDERVDAVALGSSLQAQILRRISEWIPQRHGNWRDEEENFADYLARSLAADPGLVDVTIQRNVRVEGTDAISEIDFLLSWNRPGGEREQVAVDLVRLRSPSTFLHRVSRLLASRQTVILLAVGSPALLESIQGDISRLARVNANVTVVTVADAD